MYKHVGFKHVLYESVAFLTQQCIFLNMQAFTFLYLLNHV